MRIWLGACLASLAAHLIGQWILFSLPPVRSHTIAQSVKIKISSPEKDKEPGPIPPRPEKRAASPKKRQATPNQVVQQNDRTTEEPVQGLTKESMTEGGTMAAPLGNTLMAEDTGKRLKEVDALKGDLSQPARLIPTSLIAPPYTDQALDAALEGSFIVDVFVNLDGTVRVAELRRKIGYGMDSRVIDAVKTSKFIPRKNRFGVSEEGWTELKFTLVIP